MPIHRVGYAFYKGDAIDDPDLPGEDVRRTEVEGDAQQAVAIAGIVREFIVQGIEPEDIAVLLAKRPKNRLYELLQVQRLPNGVVWAIETPGQRGSISVDTVGRFKGLEAPVVILWVGDEVVNEGQWELFYVGTTRAKSLLHVVGSAQAVATLS